MSQKIKVTVEWTESHWDTIEVEIDDGCTRESAEADIGKQVSSWMVDQDGEFDDWDYADKPPVFAPDSAQLTEPPDDAWFEVGGHKWATNGACLIREDAPRPTGMADYNKWARGNARDEVAMRFAEMLRVNVRRAPTAKPYAAHYSPILECCTVEFGVGRSFAAAALDSSGAVMALVMPLRDSHSLKDDELVVFGGAK